MKIEFNNAQIQIESQNAQMPKEEIINEEDNNNNEHIAEPNAYESGSEKLGQENQQIPGSSEKNVMISQENLKNEENEMEMGGNIPQTQSQEGVEERGDEIHHENGDEIHQLDQGEENLGENEENYEHIEKYYEADGEEEVDEENNEDGILQEEEEEHMDENNGEEFIHEENVEENNAEAEEVHIDDENNENENEEENGEYENMDELNEERDTIQKTLTQNIGEDVMQIPEQPIYVYYDPENFCDYMP